MDTKIINIEFINDDFDESTVLFSKKIMKKYSFKYNDNNTIRDLFKYLIKELDGDEISANDDEYLQEHLYVNLGDRSIKAQIDFNLGNFIKINNIEVLKLLYIFCPAGGAGAYCEEAGTIQVNHERGRHMHIPHVHIYNGRAKKGKPCIRICLKDFTPMKGENIKIKDILNNRQEEIIFGYLKNNQKKLIDFYNVVQRGGYVEPIYLDYDGQQILLK